MRQNQELVISASGELSVRTQPVEYAVVNSEAVIKSIVGEPSFSCPLTENSLFMYAAPFIHVITKIKEFDITTEWSLEEDEDGTMFETPKFETSELSLSTRLTRTYKPQFPVVMITRIAKDDAFSLRPDLSVSDAGRSFMFATSEHQLSPEEASALGIGADQPIKKFYSLPLANTDETGWLCTGPTVPVKNLFSIAVDHITQWNNNHWQGDLWREPHNRYKHGPCKKIVRFDPETHEQMDPKLEDGETVLDCLKPCSPDLNNGVLKTAWEISQNG